MKKAKWNTRITELVYSTDKGINEIARGIRVSHGTLGHWINDGTELKASNIVKMCKYFNVSADWLLGLKEERT